MKKMAFCIVPLIMAIMGCASGGAPVAGAERTPVAATNSTPAAETIVGSSPGMDLDAAIREAAVQMETKIPAKTMIALVSVASPSTAFSSQVLTRLESAIVSSGKLVVVDRANLDKVREEQGFQLSGEVDDNSAKAIGKLLGAGAIVTGTLTDLGDVYSLTLKAINIDTALVTVSYLADLSKSARVETLLASKGGAASGGTAVVSASGGQPGRTSAQAATPTPPVPAAPPAAPVAPPVPPPAPVVYKIGDTGPAGGLVFYDKGNNSGGWRYLEAAPALTEVKAKWQISFYDTGARGVEVGTGKQNTQKIIDASNQIAVIAPAARHCDRLVHGGYDDWYLPSKNELGLMYMNLKVDGLGVFSGNIYWSSSQGVKGLAAWRQNFSDGTQTDIYAYSNDQEYLVRAIRQF
ncbi:hypothetical protein AGMMS49928_28680 [Spirochaetia bacterium]|nr:hypothetical protein AGMMS49928_28680 [Spirochaetia bacterium]